MAVDGLRGVSNAEYFQYSTISTYLAKVTGREEAEVKKALELGRLFGARCDLVHNGRLPYDHNLLGEILNKLEAVDVTVLRALGGLPYGGQLDNYYAPYGTAKGCCEPWP